MYLKLEEEWLCLKYEVNRVDEAEASGEGDDKESEEPVPRDLGYTRHPVRDIVLRIHDEQSECALYRNLS